MLFVTKTVFKIAFSLLLASFFLAPVTAASAQEAPRKGEVTARVLNIRSGPGRTFRVIAKARRGERLWVLKILPKWLKVRSGGRKGFAWRALVRLAPQPAPTAEAAPAPFEVSRQPEETAKLKLKAGHLKKEIAEKEAQVSKFSEKETRVIDELDRVGRQLNQARMAVKDAEDKKRQVETALAKTEAEHRHLEEEIATLEPYAAKRLVARYKLDQLGKLPVLASADSLFELLNRKHALGCILAADKAVWEELTAKKKSDEALQVTLAEEQRQHAETIAALNVQVADMNRRHNERAKLLAEIRGKKSLMLAAIASLRQSAFALDKEMDASGWEIHPAVPEDSEANKKPFQTLKGLLQPPVPGKITVFYGLHRGDRRRAANFSNGIDIQAQPGDPIRAVDGGTVLFANWFKGYGNLIIIDHGNGYCTVYAHAEELFKKKGDHVDSHEVIGTVGDTGSLAGTRLYFEIRHHGKPINPLAWLKRN